MPLLIFFIYRLLQVVGSPLIVLYLLWRGAKNPDWLRSIPGRFGGLPFKVTAPGGIWLHAVSVGEVMSAGTLLGALRERLPDTPLYVSVTTVTGHALALEKLTDLCDGVFYTPLDYCFAVRRILRAIQPTLLIVMETEIWPNLWRETKRSGAGLLIVNARISDRAMPRYRQFRWFFAPVLAIPDAIYAQSEQDVMRYSELGALAERLHLGRNLKYDFYPDRIRTSPDIAAWVEALRPAHVVIAASTMPGFDLNDGDEDDLTFAAFEAMATPGLLWIHVPRRPERFDLAAAKLGARGIPFVRRSQLGTLTLPGILLLDTLGELSGLFPLASAVFMGGTLVRRGGHNILEPAFFGKPVVAGPHMENFAEIAREFTAAGALSRIQTAEELAPRLRALLSHPGTIGETARALAESKRGATDIACRAAIESLEANWPRRRHPLILWLLLGPLSWLWTRVGRRSRRKQEMAAQRLTAPVVCVGGLAMGGTGKTPTVLHLAEHFRVSGHIPGILTRGYRRLSPAPCTLIGAGEPAPVSETGDEAQIFVRAGIAHLGIGGDRVDVGRKLLAKWPVDVVLLDDGFQHRRLYRDFDLLLLDAQDPLSGGGVFPLGRLREEPEGLARAHAVLLTRMQRRREYRRLRAYIEEKAPGMPVFSSRVVPHGWMPTAPPAGKSAAFCGLGNPASFWATLRQMGVKSSFRWSFGDHHQYRPEELARLRQHALEAGATVLLTTEKDWMNLPGGTEELLKPLEIRWLRIGIEVENEAELLALLDRCYNKRELWNPGQRP
ncbi:MAG: tetraacyldisaccharide 4'-kinase [Bryobacteraceae bacterium]